MDGSRAFLLSSLATRLISCAVAAFWYALPEQHPTCLLLVSLRLQWIEKAVVLLKRRPGNTWLGSTQEGAG